MKCPLFRAANIAEGFDSSWDGDDCLRKECGWWDPTTGRCVTLQLAFALAEIRNRLGHLEDKLTQI